MLVRRSRSPDGGERAASGRLLCAQGRGCSYRTAAVDERASAACNRKAPVKVGDSNVPWCLLLIGFYRIRFARFLLSSSADELAEVDRKPETERVVRAFFCRSIPLSFSSQEPKIKEKTCDIQSLIP